MADTFYIKQNDTGPAIQRTLLDNSGNAVNVTSATVRFHMNTRSGTNVVDAAATLVDAANGIVKYVWQAGDTATAGSYHIEFEVTYADSSIETFPNTGYDIVEVVEELA